MFLTSTQIYPNLFGSTDGRRYTYGSSQVLRVDLDGTRTRFLPFYQLLSIPLEPVHPLDRLSESETEFSLRFILHRRPLDDPLHSFRERFRFHRASGFSC